jgi:hypothetical protein
MTHAWVIRLEYQWCLVDWRKTATPSRARLSCSGPIRQLTASQGIGLPYASRFARSYTYLHLAVGCCLRAAAFMMHAVYEHLMRNFITYLCTSRASPVSTLAGHACPAAGVWHALDVVLLCCAGSSTAGAMAHPLPALHVGRQKLRPGMLLCTQVMMVRHP